MMNILEKAYAKVNEANKIYDANPADRDKARAIYAEGVELIESQNNKALNIVWSAYGESRDHGNELLDFNDVIWEKDVDAIVRCLKENGIKEFTLSSGMSSLVEIAWMFNERGYMLAGMRKIKSGHYNIWDNDKIVEIPAYVFKLEEA